MTPAPSQPFLRLAWLATLLAGAAGAAPPTINSTPSTAGAVNERYRYDTDGRAEATGTAPIDWTLVTAPPGMDIDNLTGELYWLPSAAGSFDVELSAKNAEGEARQPFTIVVSSANPPAIAPIAVTQVSPGGRLSLQLRATGATPMVWRIVSGPAGATLGPDTGLLSWVPPATGSYSFTFSATNQIASDQRVWPVDVVSGEFASPLAAFGATPSRGEAPLLVTLDASGSASNHPTDASLSYSWDPGDGTPTRSGALASLLHGYQLPGGYRVRLTVENLYLKTAVADRPVQATRNGAIPPAAAIVADVTSGDAPLAVRFRCDCAEGDSALAAYRWDWGDGTGTTRPEGVHVFSAPGGYNVKLRVIDARGLEATDGVFVSVGQGARVPPFARARATQVAGEAPFKTQLVAELGDPDGVVVGRRWTLPDGTIVDDADPIVTLDTVGAWPVVLQVFDNDGLSSSDTLVLRATLDAVVPPEIVSEPALEAEVGVPYQYDADGRATAVGGLPVTWTLGTSADGAADVPQGMELDAATGHIRWTPRRDQRGDVHVTLTATNAAGTDVQRFTVRVGDRSLFYWVGCGAAPGGFELTALAVVLVLRLSRRRSTSTRS